MRCSGGLQQREDSLTVEYTYGQLSNGVENVAWTLLIPFHWWAAAKSMLGRVKQTQAMR